MNIPSPEAYAKAIRSGCLSAAQFKAIQTLYGFPQHSATAGQLAAVMGYKGFGGACLAIGLAGKELASALGIIPPWGNNPEANWWSIIADGDGSGSHFLWIMRPEVAKAIETLGVVNTETGVDIRPDEDANAGEYEEGHRLRVEVNIYERSREAREKCVFHYGYACAVCSFDFQKVYGEMGKNFIHVHHIIPLSELNQSYVVDPSRDLRPVCPNCHAMIHRRNPALTIEELRNKMKTN